MQRALAELDFAPGELSEDQYEVTVIIPPEEGFLGVGAVDAVVEVTLVGEEFDFYGPEDEPFPKEPDYRERGDYEEYEAEDQGWKTGPGSGEAYREGDLPTGSDGARLKVFLGRVLAEMGLSVRVRVSEGPEQVRAEFTGDDLGILIGRRGQTLDALEYLAGIVLSSEGKGRKRVELDAEGYKERRRRQLERIALRKAEEAVRRRKPVQLPPMTSAERKIIHLTLRDRKDVVTASEGREPNRWVVITPTR